MADEIEVQVARQVDADAVQAVLREHGVDVEPLDGGGALGFRILGGSDDDDAGGDLLAQMEGLIAETGLPLVPVRGDGFIFLHPPAD